MLDGGTDPRAPAAERRVARTSGPTQQRAAAGLASATRSAPPSRPSDRRPGRSRRARHARRPATRDGPSAPSSWSCAATPWPARRPLVLDPLAARMPFPVRAISVDNGSEFMAEFETASVERGIRLYVLPPRSPKLERLGRARQPHPHRGVLRGHRRSGAARRLGRRSARLGVRLQHRPTPPGARLPHPGRVPGLAQARCVTEVPDEYSPCTRRLPALDSMRVHRVKGALRSKRAIGLTR